MKNKISVLQRLAIKEKINENPYFKCKDWINETMTENPYFDGSKLPHEMGEQEDEASREIRLSKQHKIKCRCCNGKSDTWYCKECVSNGDFYHSKFKILERFAEKKIRLRRYYQKFEEYEEKLKNGNFRPTRKAELIEQIEHAEVRISITKIAISLTKEKLKRAKDHQVNLADLIATNKKNTSSFPKHIEGIKTNINSCQSRIDGRNKLLSGQCDVSKARLNLLTHDLLHTVFPIQKIRDHNNSSDEERDSDEENLRELLEEAVQTYYANGYWVRKTHNTRQANYSLFTSILPGSGHYADFLSYQFSGTEEDDMKNAQNICAGLTLLSQLVDVLFRILLVPVPKRLNFSEFSEFSYQELSKRRFQSLVNRLNITVIYLCLTQGVCARALHPTKTVSNLMTLFEGSNVDFGRHGYFELGRDLQEELSNEDFFDDGSDSDSESEWENVCNMPLSEILSISPSFQATGGGFHRRLGGDESTQSGIASAAASMISIFRGLTGTPQK